ncbi:MAG: DUF1801 domain-containing protein [Planctomycetes bacterium]|nr:DUF1801 domain-containing protein [Planctomycetota bacterium]
MQSKAATVEEYLAQLPADRRDAINAIRKAILANLDRDYAEGMSYGMIGYCVPHSVYPPGYHCNPKLPLPFAGLAAQKNYISVYLMSLYGGSPEEKWFRDAWARTGKKLDMGKCCVRFKKLEDAALEVIGEAVRRMPAKKYIAHFEKLLSGPRTQSAARSAARKKAASPAKRPSGKSAAGKSGKKAKKRASR